MKFYELTEKEHFEMLMNGKKFSENELRDLIDIYECEIIKGEPRRWTQTNRCQENNRGGIMGNIKLFKEMKRYCKATLCIDCEISAMCDKACCDFDDDRVEEAIEYLEKWSEEHPVKTRQSEFLKLYPTVTLNEEKVEYGRTDSIIDVTDLLVQILISKNADYGSAFDKTVELIPNAVLSDLFHKAFRIKNLLESDNAPKVNESIVDSFLDLAGYCILYVSLLDYNKKIEEKNVVDDKEK